MSKVGTRTCTDRNTNRNIKAQVGKKVIPMLETFLKHFKEPNRPTVCCHHCPTWQQGAGRKDFLAADRHRKTCKYRPNKRYGSESLSNLEVQKQIWKAKFAEIKETVMCNGEEIEKVDHFGYLGVHFESDGDPLATVKQRTAIAAKRFKELGMIWKREDIMTNIKTRLYSSAVLSVLKYGSETWTLTEKVINHVKSFNARRLTVMTGKSIQAEITLPTVDVWQSIRRTRYSFLGHILRDDHDKLILHNTIKSLYHDNIEGSILDDAPSTTTFEELKHYASDRARWRKHINTIFKESSSQSQTVSGPGPPATREARRDKSNARLNTPQTSSSTTLLGPSPNRPTTTITSNSNTNSATTCGVFTSNKS